MLGNKTLVFSRLLAQRKEEKETCLFTSKLSNLFSQEKKIDKEMDDCFVRRYKWTIWLQFLLLKIS